MEKEIIEIIDLYEEIISTKQVFLESIRDDSTISESLVNPLSKMKVTSKFGKRDGKNHNGIDLAAPSGTEFFSPEDGIVKFAQFTTDPCGGTLVISHPDGYESTFCHVKSFKVSEGNNVNKQDILGLTGGDYGDPGRGRTDGPHLHYQLKLNGQLVDPEKHLGSLIDDLNNNPIFKKLDLSSKVKIIDDLKKYGWYALLAAGGIAGYKVLSYAIGKAKEVSKNVSNAVASATGSNQTQSQGAITGGYRRTKVGDYIRSLPI
jgi:murein DD-endopeptidase MepM/ murein hydrolase activator NlpD